MRLGKIFFALLLTSVMSFSVLLTGSSAAAFDKSRIIDDAVFENSSSMNASQINSFLNSFSSSCISPNKGFSAVDPTGYNPTNGFLYGGYVTAGTVIYHTAQAYHINPQVLLTTLQKEQSLVSGGAGCGKLQYVGAMGYGCPDGGTTHSYSGLHLYKIGSTETTSVSGTCVSSSSDAGFSQQVIHAAWLLKFGEQRSKGNINWAEIHGSWNNSDDPQTCYGGPMTKGTFQRCPSGSTVFYDGYTTIDGTSTYIGTGATASLYWYTPHFSGNQHFVTIFTSWFGSTSFPQPIGGTLYQQTSTGKVFLVVTNQSGTQVHYHVPSWPVMVNYGFSHYPLLGADDATINASTDGGELGSLYWNSGGVYMVNNQYKYHVSSSMCTAWGLPCSDGTVVKNMDNAFTSTYLKTGGELKNVTLYGSTYYKLEGGKKRPFANTKSVSQSGFSTANALKVNEVNFTQPLGKLIVTTAGVIKFSPKATLYYYDGSNFYGIKSMSVYKSWRLNTVATISPPKSSYNASDNPAISSTITNWYADGGGTKYIINNGRKFKLSSSQEGFWPRATYTSVPSALASRLTNTSIGPFVKDGIRIYLLTTATHTKNHIPSVANYLGLGGKSSNTTVLPSDVAGAIPEGPDALASGQLVKLDSSNSIYAVNGNSLLSVPSMSLIRAYGFTPSTRHYSDTAFKTSYPIAGTLDNAKKSDDSAFIPYNGELLYFTSSQAYNYGLKTTGFKVVNDSFIGNAKKVASTQFIRNMDDGRIYYASGQALHYVATYSAYLRFGGASTKMTYVNTPILNNFGISRTLY